MQGTFSKLNFPVILGLLFIFSSFMYAGPLHNAAKTGDLTLVLTLLADPNANINKRSKEGHSPLHLAVIYGRIDVVIALLADPRVNVNTRDADGWTALHLAIVNGRVDIMQLLLDVRDMHVNALDDQGQTIMHIAAGTGQVGIINFLLTNQRVRVDRFDHDGWTALHYAAAARTPEDHDPVETIRLLLDDSRLNQLNLVTAIDRNGRTILHFAAMVGNEETVRVFLADPRIANMINTQDSEVRSALQMATEEGHIDVVKLLLEAGALYGENDRQEIENLLGIDPAEYLSMQPILSYLRTRECGLKWIGSKKKFNSDPSS